MEITIMKLSEDVNLDARDYINLLHKYTYNDEAGNGFKDLNIEENNSVSGFVVKRTPIFINVFDTETETIVEREDFIISETYFVIDTIYKLIEIHGSAKDVKKLTITFLQTIVDTVKLQPLTIKPSRILEALQEETETCEIKKLQIKDFSSEKGVIGSYDIKSIDSKLAWKFVEEYRNEIVKSTIFIDKSNVDAKIEVFQNGKFKISAKPRNNTDLILYTIKNLISKNLQ